VRDLLDLIEVGSKRERAPWEQPIYTQEQRLGECIFLLCSRNPAEASAIAAMLDRNGLSNGWQIMEHRLKLMHDTFQRGLPILG
jgi:hypothetical protein